MLTNGSYSEKARWCAELAEKEEEEAKRIKRAWRNHHIRARAEWRSRQHWWERKVELLTDHEADIMAEWSCKSDRRYKTAMKYNEWYIQQATMYAQMASLSADRFVKVPGQTRRVRVDDGVF